MEAVPFLNADKHSSASSVRSTNVRFTAGEVTHSQSASRSARCRVPLKIYLSG